MLNKAILMGRLTRDPEMRQTQSGIPVTTFTLAVDRGRKSNDPNQPTADFIDVVAWNQQAEFVVKYFRKGQLVAVSGRIQTRKWTDQSNNNRVSVEVIAEELHFAEPKRDYNGGGDNTYYGAPPAGVARSGAQQAKTPAAPAESDGFDEITDDDGDLPF